MPDEMAYENTKLLVDGILHKDFVRQRGIMPVHRQFLAVFESTFCVASQAATTQ